jgi:endonuclease/exonuclease/phosphatase family metal-dependent hydrolase
MPVIRLATFNLEELDDVPSAKPTLAERIRVMRPQLDRLRPDIVCLQEVHGQGAENQPRQLEALDQLVAGTPLAGFHRVNTTTNAGDVERFRNLVILSRFAFIGPAEEISQNKLQGPPQYRRVTAIPPDAAAQSITWERPILKVRIDLGQNRVLHVLNVHMKSKIPSTIPGQFHRRGSFNVFHTSSAWAEGVFISAMKRIGQAMEARIVIDELFDAAEAAGEEALIAICGDFNDDNNQTPMKAIRGPIEEIGNEALLNRIMIPCEQNIPEPARYSLLHLGHGEMIDHILVSRGMLRFFRGTEIHNETLPDESGAFRTDKQFPESDHAPVVATFELP